MALWVDVNKKVVIVYESNTVQCRALKQQTCSERKRGARETWLYTHDNCMKAFELFTANSISNSDKLLGVNRISKPAKNSQVGPTYIS